MNKHCYSTARRGFTLIEILAVIVIIASLAAILLPVASSSVAAAKKTVCISNLYQVGVATGLYLADNDDTYPEIVNYFTRYDPNRRPQLGSGTIDLPAQAFSLSTSDKLVCVDVGNATCSPFRMSIEEKIVRPVLEVVRVVYNLVPSVAAVACPAVF